jgi:hypothetical protein
MIDIKTHVIRISLTIEEVNQILTALQEMPAKICNPLSTKIHVQAESQIPKEDQLKQEETEK